MVKRWLRRILAALFVLAGLGFLALVVMSFGRLKGLAGALMPDGEFETLKVENWIVFRSVFLAGFLVSGALAYLSAFRRWSVAGTFLKQLWDDTRRFFSGLRPQKGDLWFWGAVLAFMVVGVFLRLEYIYSPFHHDDAYTYMAFARSLRTALTDYHLPNNHVFHTVLVYFSTQLFGNAPWALRQPSFTATVLLIPAAYALGKRVYDRWVGLTAAAFVAVAPVMTSYANSTRGYPWVMLFALLTLILGDIVRREKNLFAWALIVLFSALGFFTVPVMMYPFGILFLWLLLENQVAGLGAYSSKWDFLRCWLAAGFSSAALTLVFYLPILVVSGPGKLFGNQFISPAPWEDEFNIFVYQMTMTVDGLKTHLPELVFWILVVGVVLGIVFHQRISVQKIPLQAVAFGWLALLVVVQRPKDGSKLWSVLVVLFFIWAAAGIAGLLGKIKPKILRGAPLLTIIGLATLLFISSRRAVLIGSELSELWVLRGDQENVVLFIQEQLRSGDEIVVASSDGAAVWYYAELHGITDAFYSADEEFERLFVLVNPVEEETLEFVVTVRGPGMDAVELGDAELVETIGSLQVYTVPAK